MASPSPLLIILTQDTTKVQQAGSKSTQEASNSEPSKLPRGRKPSKSSKSPLKKKPSQRGMGVERLERLRLQEKWGGGNMPEVAGFPHHQFQAPPLIPGSDLNRSTFMVAPKVSQLGGGSCNNVTREWVGGLLETSGKELSSIPKVQCHQCEKKCMNMDEMGIILGGKDKVVPSTINCHVLTGLNHGLEMKDFNPRAIRQLYHQANKVNKEAELLGITRQGSVIGERSATLKEYEFFPPGKSLKEYEFFPPGKSLKEYEFFPGASTGRSSRRSSEQLHHPEAASSYFIGTDHQHNVATNNAIDLTLKLSL